MSEKIESEEISLSKVLREELNHIKEENSPVSGDEKLEEVLEDFHNANLSALCFSGGGIRSATFGLGIVQALAKHDLLDKFDYLSTVSGGGYMGAWLSAWIRREQMISVKETEAAALEKELAAMRENAPEEFDGKNGADLRKKVEKLNADLFETYRQTSDEGVKAVQKKLKDQKIEPPVDESPPCPNPEPEQLQHLREYSNYMSPKVGLLSADTWTLLAIYTRNLFLNWTIFIPLLGAILLLPRILLAFVRLPESKTPLSLSLLSLISATSLSFLLLLVGLILGIVAVVATVAKLPSKNEFVRRSNQENIDSAEKARAVKYNSDLGIFTTVILPLATLALAATTFWAWHNLIPKTAPSKIPGFLKFETFNFIIFSALVFVPGNLGFHLYQKLKFGKTNFKFWEFGSALLSGILGGCLTRLLAYNFFDENFFTDAANDSYHLPIYLCLAVPLYLICFTTASTVFVGLNSRSATDEDREWLARQGALLLIVAAAWLLLNALVLFAPVGLEKLIDSLGNLFSGERENWTKYFSPLVPIIAAISGFISLVGGFSGESKVGNQPAKGKISKFLAFAPKVAAPVFLVSIFVVLAWASSLVLASVGGFLNNSLQGEFAKDARHLDILYHSNETYLLLWLLLLAFVGIGMACFVNVNKFSLHAAYRDRLIRAYLGASRTKRRANTFTGFDDADNFQLHRLKGQKPFHVINATLNLIAGKNLAWQNRKAASFTMSPLHCGSWLLGYRNTNKYCRNENLLKCEHLRFCNQLKKPCANVEQCQLKGKALRLGTAMTISGAAANPNMGYYSSAVVTFLMSLFNIRLGWWLGNTGKRGTDKDWFGLGKKSFYEKPSPSIAILPLINETLGRTDEDNHFLSVTDGGHFENLGLYEMILRRCKLIVLSDAAADENFTFGEISNAIEKCKVDLGVNINFKKGINICSRNGKVDEKTVRDRFAIAEIIYPETVPPLKEDVKPHRKGYLIYIRPTFYGDEATEIKHYADANLSFPHQSTADQLYDEKQFEAYRSLGFCIMEKVYQEKAAKELLDSLKKESDA